MAKATQTRPPVAATEEQKAEKSPAEKTPVSVTITIPLSGIVSKRYMSGRCDTDLKRSEALIMRRIQDMVEDGGQPCKGPAAVLRYMLALIAQAEAEGEKTS